MSRHSNHGHCNQLSHSPFLSFLSRIHKYACCSNECFILALIYIDRLIQRNNFLLTELNVHRVVITAVLLAAKFFDDAYYNNAYYSKVGGVLVSEMNGLEVDFLFRINFSLHVQPDVFDKYKAELVAHSINSGLAMTPFPTPLPQISEVESCHSGMSSPDVMQQQQQLVHAAAAAAVMHSAANSNFMIVPPVQVTPSPNLEDMASHLAMGVGPLQPPPVPIPNLQNPLYVPGSGVNEQQQTIHGNDVGLAHAEQQEQQQCHALLQRANSLPPFPSGLRCVDQSRYPPYYSAPTPMAPVLPLVNVDQEQYQLVMNQLFPIQTTLMHHNHAVGAAASGHHSNIAANNTHQGYHHSGIQGAGMGAGGGSSLVAHY
jgi:Cyclin